MSSNSPITSYTEFAKLASAQTNVDGSIHAWYRMRLGFSDHLVSSLIDEFELTPESGTVLDPFCGAGTTLVECKKKGIAAIGIDANPSSVFASRVKLNWDLDIKRLRGLLDEIEELCHRMVPNYSTLARDCTYQYLDRTGLIKRGWICVENLLDAIAIKQTIARLPTRNAYKDFFMLALITEIIEEAANVKFGPELYCGPPRMKSDVLGGFVDRAESMIDDVHFMDAVSAVETTVFCGDSRNLVDLLPKSSKMSIAAIICSPPYPAEHDYTRNARLELAFLGQVHDKESLRNIKRAMIRCHTKGIYKDDNDSSFVESNPTIKKLVASVDAKARRKQHGFARLYGKVIQEYFGGMLKHFESARQLMKRGSYCAYVVGDQSAYLQVHVPTASILSELAQESGFEYVDIKRWRTRRVSTTKKLLNENVLILRKR
jgi:DNA modification methylase